MAGDPLEPRHKKPSVKVFDCPNCGASIPLRAIGLTVTVACESCGSLIDVANENLAIIDTATRKARMKPLIPLGRRGKLFGDTWEVIGFMARATPSGQYPWREYLLFNPYKGFRWLTESEGHWNFVRTTKERPRRAPGSQFVEFHGDAYRQFEKGLAKVTYVIGEFYWRVKVDDTVAVEDFIHPPMSCPWSRTSRKSTGRKASTSSPRSSSRPSSSRPPCPFATASQPTSRRPSPSSGPRSCGSP